MHIEKLGNGLGNGLGDETKEKYFLSKIFNVMKFCVTVGRSLIAWFNSCILGKSGQIVNPIIVKVNPVPHCSICACLCL